MTRISELVTLDPRPFGAVAETTRPCFDCLSALSVAVCVLDAGGRVVYTNRSFADVFPGRAAGHRDPQPFAEAFPEVADRIPDLAELIAAAERASHVREVQLAELGDAACDKLVHLDPIPGDNDRSRAGWVMTFVDISDVRRAERSSRNILEIERFVSQLSSRFVGTADRRPGIEAALQDLGLKTGASRTFIGIFDDSGPGFSELIEWTGDAVRDLREGLLEHGAELRRWWQQEFGDLEVVQIDDLHSIDPFVQQIIRSIGGQLEGSLIVAPLHFGGEMLGAIGLRHHDSARIDESTWLVTDIAAHILERVIQLQRTDEAAQRYNRELQETTAQLLQSEKMASLGQMAAGVAHEINNPIGFIMSNLSTLADYSATIKSALEVVQALAADADDAVAGARERLARVDVSEAEYVAGDLDDLLDESLEGCVRVKDIIQNLKSFARADEKRSSAVDLSQCVESTLKIVWNELKYRCEVVKDYGEIPPVVCFPGQINQVIMNLLVNAAHAIAEQGTITITTRAQDGMVELAIADTGVGIAAENLPRLFDPFFTTKEPGKGTGLGLYICRNIVDAHGGSFEVVSEVGAGTTFTLRLPPNGPPSATEELPDA